MLSSHVWQPIDDHGKKHAEQTKRGKKTQDGAQKARITARDGKNSINTSNFID